MLKIHTELAENVMSLPKTPLSWKNGDVLALTKDSARCAGHFNAEDVYVDGSRR